MRLALLALVACKHPGSDVVDGDAEMRSIEHPATVSVDGWATLEVAVADGDTSFLVNASGGDVLSLDHIIDPNGDIALNWEDWTGHRTLTNAFFPCDEDSCVTDFAVNWPVRAEDGPLVPGAWQVVVATTDPDFNWLSGGVVNATTLVKRDPDLALSTVPVNIVYAAGVGDNAEVVAAVEGAVEHWRGIWAPYGLTLAERYSTSDVDAHLAYPSSGDDALRAASATSEVGEITVLIGEDLGGATSYLGMAGGIPGALVEGPRSGVVVGWLAGSGTDAQFTEEEIVIMAGTMAHEVGHFQGLLHPVESTYTAWDALDDTPECGARSGCERDVGNNLMFPYTVLDIGPQEDLSAGQVGVIMNYVGSP